MDKYLKKMATGSRLLRKIPQKTLLTGQTGKYIIHPISCEAEITNANDPKESGEQVEASRENGRSNGPPSVRGKAESRIPQRVATVTSWGMCWHFQ
ncbi:MAG: hypothetical protein ABFC31_06930 [Clostridiaceae bacterium]